MADPFSLALGAGSLGLGIYQATKAGKSDRTQEFLDKILARRRGEIQQFGKELEAVRQRRAQKIQNIKKLQFSLFAPEQEAQFASRGLSVSGGSFASALAKKAAELESQAALADTEAERQDLLAQQELLSNLGGSEINAVTGAANSQNQTSALNAQRAGLAGQLIGQGAAMGLGELFSPTEKVDPNRYEPSVWSKLFNRKSRNPAGGEGDLIASPYTGVRYPRNMRYPY